MRAERQSSDYDQKAERQIAFATDNDDAATAERDLAAKEEKRARDSAYLAADMKTTIDKLLEEGRDQVRDMRQVSPSLFAGLGWNVPISPGYLQKFASSVCHAPRQQVGNTWTET